MEGQSAPRFTLLHLFAAVPYFGLTFGVARLLESPYVAVHLSLLFVCWFLVRVERADPLGTCLLLFGADILLCNGISGGHFGHEDLKKKNRSLRTLVHVWMGYLPIRFHDSREGMVSRSPLRRKATCEPLDTPDSTAGKALDRRETATFWA